MEGRKGEREEARTGKTRVTVVTLSRHVLLVRLRLRRIERMCRTGVCGRRSGHRKHGGRRRRRNET